MPGVHTPESANYVLSKVVQSHGPGVQRAVYWWGAQYSFGTGISHREQPSLAGTSGPISAPFWNSLWGPSPYYGPHVAILPTGCQWSCLYSHLNQQLGWWWPPVPSAVPPISLSLLVREVKSLRAPPAGDPSSSPPSALLLFLPSEMEQQPEVVAGFSIFNDACSLFILMLMASLFQIGALIEKWQKTGAKPHIFWRGRTEEVMRGR